MLIIIQYDNHTCWENVRHMTDMAEYLALHEDTNPKETTAAKYTMLGKLKNKPKLSRQDRYQFEKLGYITEQDIIKDVTYYKGKQVGLFIC